MKKKYISNLPPSRKLNLTRRHFVEATSALVGAGLLSSYGLPIYAASNVDEMMKMYKQANIDWESQKGSSIVLSGLEHPWMSSIEPLLSPPLLNLLELMFKYKNKVNLSMLQKYQLN